MSESLPQVYLARHGETAWTISRQHTGRTDIPLTRRVGKPMPAAWVSGSRERRSTGSLSARSGGLEGPASWPGSVIDVDPMPTCWNGTTVRMRDGPRPRSGAERPGWYLFRDGCLGGESVEAVAARADRVVAGLKEASGRVIMFGHSHFFRVLASRWLGLPAADARFYVLGTAALSVLGYEHALDEPAILLWNDDRHAVT